MELKSGKCLPGSVKRAKWEIANHRPEHFI